MCMSASRETASLGLKRFLGLCVKQSSVDGVVVCLVAGELYKTRV